MFHVYVLYSPQYDKIYIGQSSDVGVRFIYHNQGPTKGWTSRFRPWVLVHLEIFEKKSQVLKREKELKTASGRRWIRTVILRQ
ncbi:hypothetical protein BH23BAC3_BH23BAC3_25090 [soil metagenome]